MFTSPDPSRPCGRCRYFGNTTAEIETAFPGLPAMCSSHASVRAHDGLCRLHDVYLSWRDTCPDFSPSAPPPPSVLREPAMTL